MRLIDADKIKYIEYINGDISVSKEEIEKQPTVDANPVIHAHWVADSDYPDTYECSHCGHRIDMYFYDTKDFKYCNNCNAVMDEII